MAAVKILCRKIVIFQPLLKVVTILLFPLSFAATASTFAPLCPTCRYKGKDKTKKGTGFEPSPEEHQTNRTGEQRRLFHPKESRISILPNRIV